MKELKIALGFARFYNRCHSRRDYFCANTGTLLFEWTTDILSDLWHPAEAQAD